MKMDHYHQYKLINNDYLINYNIKWVKNANTSVFRQSGDKMVSDDSDDLAG